MSKGTSRHQDHSFEPIQSLYDHPLQRNSLENHTFRKTAVFWTFWPNSAISGGRTWLKLSKGTSTYRDLSYEPFPRSLRPSVTKKQPGKAHVSKNRCFRTFWRNSAISGGQNCQKAHLQAKTFHMSLFPGLYDHPLQRYSLEKNR